MTHFATAPDGLAIAYDVVGKGPPVVLIHGFAASRVITWRNTLWYDWLSRAGHTVIALDCRGHGESDKPHDTEAYDDSRMLSDVVAVMQGAGFESADIMGYSMGGYMTINIAHEMPQRIRRAVIGGVGANYFTFWATRDKAIADAMLAEDKASINDTLGREFRDFADRAGNDRVALAACMRRRRFSFSRDELKTITTPAIVVVGALDNIAGPPEPLAQSLGNATAVVVPRRNHHSAVGDLVYKKAVKEFLSQPSAQEAP